MYQYSSYVRADTPEAFGQALIVVGAVTVFGGLLFLALFPVPSRDSKRLEP